MHFPLYYVEGNGFPSCQYSLIYVDIFPYCYSPKINVFRKFINHYASALSCPQVPPILENLLQITVDEIYTNFREICYLLLLNEQKLCVCMYVRDYYKIGSNGLSETW